MGFKHFRINILIRVLIMCALAFALVYASLHTHWLMTCGFILLLEILVVMELVRYVEKTNRDVNSLVEAIQHHDFSRHFSAAGRGKSYDNLRDVLNEVIQAFRQLRLDKESHYQYLQTVIEHVSVALLCFDEEGEVILMNEASKKLLRRPYMKHVSSMNKIDEELAHTIENLKSGDRGLVKVMIREKLLHIAVYVTIFSLQGKTYRLVSLQNIKGELDERELEAWQKLIRVLTHEIMNSVTPIISLASVMNGMLEDGEGNQIPLEDLSEDDVADIRASLQTIEKRSKGLVHFVEAYRNLTRIPEPKLKEITINQLLDDVLILLRPELARHELEVKRIVEPDDLKVLIDSELIVQVLINLIVNAIQATQKVDQAEVVLHAKKTQAGRVVLLVKDNGYGIKEEHLDKVFVPFFTTKKNGSGIGLSLSRQIMRLHKGGMSVQSVPGGGTVFSLEF